jgi:hypothetical protein
MIISETVEANPLKLRLPSGSSWGYELAKSDTSWCPRKKNVTFRTFDPHSYPWWVLDEGNIATKFISGHFPGIF